MSRVLLAALLLLVPLSGWAESFPSITLQSGAAAGGRSKGVVVPAPPPVPRAEAQQSVLFPPPPARVAFTTVDLTAYTTEMADSASNFEWPYLPAPTVGPIAVTTCADLIDRLDDGLTAVTVGAGVTIGSVGTPCGTINIASETTLDLDDTAVIWGTTMIVGDSQFVRIDGGEIHLTTQLTITGGADITINNVKLTQPGGPCIEANGITARIAVTNNDLTAGSYGFLTDNNGSPPSGNRHFSTLIAANDIVCATNTDEACVRVQDGEDTIYAYNNAFNTVGLKSCYRMFDGTRNALMAANQCQTWGLTGYEVRSTGDAAAGTYHRGNIINVWMVDNFHFEDRGSLLASSYLLSIFGGQSNGAGGGNETCDGFTMVDNEVWTTGFVAATFGQSVSACENVVETGSVAGNLSLTPYFGTIPTCTSLGTCGADH